jgi:hypothetical protein
VGCGAGELKYLSTIKKIHLITDMTSDEKLTNIIVFHLYDGENACGNFLGILWIISI